MVLVIGSSILKTILPHTGSKRGCACLALKFELMSLGPIVWVKMTYSSSSLPSAESVSSANYACVNKFRADRRKSLHQLRGEVLGLVVVVAQAHRRHLEWRRAVRAQFAPAHRRDHPAPNFLPGPEPLPGL
jgi:hypothetical protein